MDRRYFRLATKATHRQFFSGKVAFTGLCSFAANSPYSVHKNAYRSKKSAERTQINGLISRALPVPILMNVKESRPRLSPVAMLNVRGVATSVINAGKASLKSSQRTLATEPHISAPTRISAGAVAYT